MRKPNIKAVLSTIIPWFVILGLIYIALFVQPGELGETVEPSPISAVDRYYGGMQVDGDVFWLVGNYGKIIKSTDSGKSWVIQPTQTSENLQSIDAWNTSHAVVVGDHSTILVTRDGGKTWTVPVGTGKYHKLISVQVFSDGRAWAVGAWGTILMSDDGGSTWKRMRSRHDVTLHDIASVGRKMWSVGEFGTILYSSDNGDTWKKQESGVVGTLTSVHFRDPVHGVITELDGAILTTFDGGQSWSKAEFPGHSHFLAVSWNGSRWLAAADGGVVATAGPSGTNWQLTRLGPRNHSWHTSVVSAGRGWLLVGSSVGLYEDGHWTNLSSVRRSGASS